MVNCEIYLFSTLWTERCLVVCLTETEREKNEAMHRRSLEERIR